MHSSKITILILVLFTLVSGCSNSKQNKVNSVEPNIQGYVIDISTNRLLVVWDIEYEQIESKSIDEILRLAQPNAMYLTYKNAKDFAKGDLVDIWTTGEYNTSYPGQGTATKIIKRET